MRSSVSFLSTASLAAYLAAASPQQLDFAQVQAAPAVASGPVDNGIANQTATLATSYSVTGVATAGATGASRRSLVRRQDNVDSSNSASFGHFGQTTNVQAGDLYWLNGAATHNFYGNIVNSGKIVVSQTNALGKSPGLGGQTSDWVGHDANNGNLKNNKGALIQLNDFGSKSAPTYDWYIRQMQNDGTVQWCGRGDTGGSTYQMYNDLDSTNNGLISFEQFYNNLGAAFVWRNPTLSTSKTPPANLYNNGAFRLINVNYHNVQNILGNGCWQLGKGAILYLEDGTGVFQNPQNGPSFPQQNIIFQDASAVLHMDTAVYSHNSDFGAQVFGFGDGNAIEFYEIMNGFSYDAGRGILNVRFVGGNSVNIKIGKGYDSSRFYQQRNPQKYNTAGYNAVYYRGSAPPQSAPGTCSISAPACGDLGSNPPTGGNPPVTSPTGRTSTDKPTTTSPTSTDKPTTTSPTSTGKPTTTSPTSTGKPTTTSPTSTDKPTTTSPTSTGKPTTSPTSTDKPTTSPTSTDKPTSTSPTKTSPTDTGIPNTTSLPPQNSGTYTPYYPALATSYTTDPALGSTTNPAPACPTQPEAGTYCGFINPLDPCAPQPDGFGPVPTPDTASAFLKYAPFHSSASAAPATVAAAQPSQQYVQTFKDLNAASAAQSYLALWTLKTYNTAECASRCDENSLCTAFNLFIERDPSLNPSSQVSSAPTVWGYICPNPPSMTSFKCTLWGSSLNASTATNSGQRRADFDVVITGSNGYDKTKSTTPKPPPGYQPPTSCGGKAIDAPEHHLGSRFFPGPFNVGACGDYARAQGRENQKAGASGVRMFNAYELHKNGRPHGTYCSLYAIALGTERATYAGGVSGGDKYECGQSWTFEAN